MVLETLAMCLVGALAFGLTIYFNGPFFLGLMSSDESVLSLGMYRLRYVTVYLFMNGLLDVVVNSIRGFGISTLPTLVTLFGVCGFRIFYIYTWFAANHTPASLYLCFPLSWTVTFIIQSVIWIFVYRNKTREMNEGL